MNQTGFERSTASSAATSPAAIWAGLLAVYVVWGSTYLAIRFAVETMPPFLMAGVRFTLAGAVLYAWRRLSGDPRPTRVEWRSAAIVGGLLLLGGNGSVVWAEQRVASGIAALLVGSAPLWMVLMDALRPNGRRPSGWTLLGVLVGFLGIVLLVGPAQITGLAGEVDSLGGAVLTLAAVLWAAGSLYNRGAQLPNSPLLGTGMEMLAGGIGLMLLGTLTGEWTRLDLGGIAPRSLLGMGYLIVFGSWVGFAAYTWLLRVAPTMLVSTYAYVNPLVAIFIGNWLAQETLTPRVLLATAIIVSSVALITLTQPAGKKRSIPESEREAVPLISSGDD
ncbi:MAG TPA: EamA family transporter [Anaerolineales bacterium]|nr:EamA family transporter [Anaerolineales bacterium]